jgi:ketosteroid isomerase-like protein
MPNHHASLAGAVLFSCACAHRVDVVHERQALLDADAQFARDSAARGVEAWTSWFAENGTMYPPTIAPIEGRQAIREAMDDLYDPRTGKGDFRLEWAPIRAEVSESGELGWTTGTSRAIRAQGERRGRYITIWRKQSDGSWKVSADLGNQGPLTSAAASGLRQSPAEPAPPPAVPAGQKPPG